MGTATCPNCGEEFTYKEEEVLTNCPHCHAALIAAADMDFECPNCQSELTVDFGTTDTWCPTCGVTITIAYPPDNDIDKIRVIASKLN